MAVDESGTGLCRVMAFANYSDEQYFIVLYRYSEWPSLQTKYRIAYRIEGGVINKIDIEYMNSASCQINHFAQIMVYSYRTLTNRILGVITFKNEHFIFNDDDLKITDTTDLAGIKINRAMLLASCGVTVQRKEISI